MSLASKPTCNCCSTVRDYIMSHLDPNGTLEPGDNAVDVIAGFDDVFADEGGAGVSVEDMAEYIAELDDVLDEDAEAGDEDAEAGDEDEDKAN